MCEDCGSPIYKRGCTNCNEESYIYYDQVLPENVQVSDKFLNKVKQQQKSFKKHRDQITLGRFDNGQPNEMED